VGLSVNGRFAAVLPRWPERPPSHRPGQETPMPLKRNGQIPFVLEALAGCNRGCGQVGGSQVAA
jgi:hypothetical protein